MIGEDFQNDTVEKGASALEEASKTGGDWESPIGGEETEKDLGHLQVLCTPLSSDLRVLPCGFPVPKGEGLEVEL